MSIRYVGNFPPPYGGVTIKNDLLCGELSKRTDIKRLRKPAWMPNILYKACGMLTIFSPAQQMIVGISSRSGKSHRVTQLLYIFRRKVLHRSLYFMMGGTETKEVATSKKLLVQYGCYKRIYVEMPSMKECLLQAGLQNVSVYPNCRKRPQISQKPAFHKDKPLRCVFFSLISKDKGADTVLAAAKQLPQVQFDFYGVLDPSYAVEFQQEIQLVPNAQYHGIFEVNGDNVYEKLNEYDLLLLPTRALTEGIPGVLVEAKIAAVPAIVSDICYNSEIVEHGISGIVLKENTTPALVAAIAALDTDREQLYRLKQGALRSAEKYYIENYLEEILKVLET